MTVRIQKYTLVYVRCNLKVNWAKKKNIEDMPNFSSDKYENIFSNQNMPKPHISNTNTIVYIFCD